MFTGIIEGIGKILKVVNRGKSIQINVLSPFSLAKEKIGDSIALNGCCLTIVQKKGKSFTAEISPETIDCSTLGDLQSQNAVNLERPLRLSDRLGGHLVQGHVDGIITLIRRKETKADRKTYLFLEFSYPQKLKKYLVKKGSVAIDGVSLTINQVDSKKFSVCLIPHTQQKTILTDKKVGDSANVEVDWLGKLVENFFKNNGK